MQDADRGRLAGDFPVSGSSLLVSIDLKKTLRFPQNLENKGLEFFCPARSMILKVVRGKILETLELHGLSTPGKPWSLRKL